MTSHALPFCFSASQPRPGLLPLLGPRAGLLSTLLFAQWAGATVVRGGGCAAQAPLNLTQSTVLARSLQVCFPAPCFVPHPARQTLGPAFSLRNGGLHSPPRQTFSDLSSKELGCSAALVRTPDPHLSGVGGASAALWYKSARHPLPAHPVHLLCSRVAGGVTQLTVHDSKAHRAVCPSCQS